jgi:hypothetical protein
MAFSVNVAAATHISCDLEVCIKEHKYNLTQGVLKKSKLAQDAYKKKATTDVGKKQRPCRLTEHHLQEIRGICLHVSGRSSGQPSLDISPILTPTIAAKVRKLQLSPE